MSRVKRASASESVILSPPLRSEGSKRCAPFREEEKQPLPFWCPPSQGVTALTVSIIPQMPQKVNSYGAFRRFFFALFFRPVGVVEAARSSRVTQTKQKSLKSLRFQAFFVFLFPC